MTWTGVAKAMAAGAVGFGFVVACSAGDKGDGAAPIGQGGGGNGGSGGSGATSNGGSGSGAQGGTLITGGTSNQGGTGGFDSDAACTSSRSQADAAVDIIWVVDNSCSMGDEIEKVRTNINNSFLNIIEGSNLAWNMIFVSEKGNGSNALCIDSPPAGANCADNPPRFHHLNCTVGSTNPLSVASFTYNGHIFPAFPFAEPIFPCTNQKWRDWLRFQSTKVFVIVTDDEAGEDPFVVDTWLTETADPSPFPGMFGTKADRKYIMNAIIGMDPANPGAACTSATNQAEAPGVNYQQLASLTGGTVASICEDDWSTIFNDVANTLVEGLGCEYQVPNPPPGETLDPNLVNVSYTPGGSTTEETVLQDDTAPCDGGADGWQWSPNKDKVLLCGDTCDRVRSDPEGKVDVLFGCGTERVPPK